MAKQTPLGTEQHLLATLVEEAGEVVKAYGKAMRFGLDEIGPGQTLTNRELLEVEAVHFVTVYEMLMFMVLWPRPDKHEEIKWYKQQRVLHYMDVARQQGSLK